MDLVLHTIRDPRGFVLSSKKNAKMDAKAAISVYNGYHSRVLRASALAGVPALPVPYCTSSLIAYFTKSFSVSDCQTRTSCAR